MQCMGLQYICGGLGRLHLIFLVLAHYLVVVVQSELCSYVFVIAYHWNIKGNFVFQNFFSGSDKPDDAWVPYYKKFVGSIIHLTKLDSRLHKGDFYINTSFAVPGHLIVKYHDAGNVRSIPLEAEDFPVMWKRDWTDKMRIELQGRFLFLNCVVNTKRGLERRPWRYLMSEFGNVSIKQFKGE